MPSSDSAKPPRQTSIVGKLFSREPISGTRLQSMLFAAGLTSIPLALLLSGNSGEITDRQPIFVVLLGAFLVSASLALALGRKLAPHVAGALVGGLGYGFFSLSWVPEGTSTPILFLFWIVSSVGGAAIVVWLLSDSKLIITLAGAAVTALTAFLLLGSTSTRTEEVANPSEAPPATLAFSDPLIRTPNVYVLVLDGFGRPDILADDFQDLAIDLDDSVEALNNLGFIQDPSGSANYTQSLLSIPSTLNGDYHHLPEAPLSGFEQWEQGRQALQGDNLLVNSLRSAGYEYWHASSVVWDASACNPEVADRCLGPDTSDQETVSALWSLTPVRNHVGIVAFEDFADPPSVVSSVLDARSDRASDSPYIVFSHIVSPHQPYRFEQNCEFRGRNETGTTLAVGHLPEHRQLYVDQTHCLALQLEESIATLVEADPDALIFLQADHGTAFGFDGDFFAWDDARIRERLGIFRMTRLPDSCRHEDPAAQSLVNTPQLVLSCLSGEQPEWVEPRLLLVAENDTVIDGNQALVPPVQ